MIKAKDGFVIHKMSDSYMIIAVGDASADFKDIFQINETGAFYWSLISKGTTVEDMVKASMERFEDLSETEARKDIEEFLENIKDAVEEV